ncbi:hypothetical protein Tco_1504955 [Tanacetum coccineum]
MVLRCQRLVLAKNWWWSMLLEKDLVGFALQEMEIHPLMFLIHTLSMIFQTFSPTLHNPSTNHTRASYVEMILTMVMIVHYDSRLSIGAERVTIQNLVFSDNYYSTTNSPGNSYKKKELQHLVQVANLSTYHSQRFKSFCYEVDDDYDYEDSTIPLNEIDSQIPPSIAIIPVLPTLEPEDSLIIGDEELSTIPEKESDEFIKSSVEDLVPILSESEDTSESDSECILPLCDDFSPINIYEEKSMTFSNPLFDSNDDFTSSDDESLSNEDVPKDNVKIYSNPLFEFDDEYISSDVNPLFDEVFRRIEDCPDYKDSRACGFVHRLLDLQSFTCFYIGIRYPRSY